MWKSLGLQVAGTCWRGPQTSNWPRPACLTVSKSLIWQVEEITLEKWEQSRIRYQLTSRWSCWHLWVNLAPVARPLFTDLLVLLLPKNSFGTNLVKQLTNYAGYQPTDVIKINQPMWSISTNHLKIYSRQAAGSFPPAVTRSSSVLWKEK